MDRCRNYIESKNRKNKTRCNNASKNKLNKDITGCMSASNEAPDVIRAIKNVTDGMTDHTYHT